MVVGFAVEMCVQVATGHFLLTAEMPVCINSGKKKKIRTCTKT